nr:reverse transcriptase domain-containing protein [Tanacetum cinerariifolium]
MPFELKITGATYQCLVDKAFQKQIGGQKLEVYVDNLVIKSRTEQEVIRDIEETFKTLREINMKLNPKKCTFRMRVSMFLGYKVNADGLEVCSDKVKEVLSLPYPKCLKDVQKLNGKLASLNRFLSKSAKKSLPFFKTLKKCIEKSDFQWTAEAETTFKQMKTLIAELPMLTSTKGNEELVIYLAAAKEAISAVLMTKWDGKQMPIYFVSRALQGPKINYTPMEKLLLSLYRPRTSVKGHILADFIVERPEDDSLDTPMKDKEELPDPWILFTDGSSCVDGFGAGLIITNPEGIEFTYDLRSRSKTLPALLKNSLSNKYPGERKKADTLSKMTSTSFVHLSKQVLVEELKEKSIDEKEVLAVVEEEERTWMTLIYEYLTEEILLEEKRKARAIRRKAGPGKVKFLIVAIDYFTKWIEAKPVNPQDNDLVERANKSLGEGIKARNGEMPFSLTYGTKAVIPVEIGMPTLRTVEVDMIRNDEALEINLDLLEEKRDQTAIQEAKSKAKMEKYYNVRVRNTSFKLADRVYRNNEASHAEDGGKLGTE